MALVIMRHGLAATGFERRARLRTVEGLDLTFLIQAQHQRMFGRIQIQTHDIFQFLGELGIVADAQETVKMIPSIPRYRRDLLEACLQLRPATELDRIAGEAESTLRTPGDPESLYYQGAVLSFCGQKEHAMKLLHGAILGNYCAYAALQTDPLLAKLRSTSEFSELLSAAKECQNKFLSGQQKQR